MATSADWGIPLVAGSQDQPEITVNEALVALNVLAVGVARFISNAPPDVYSPTGDAVEGDVNIVGTAPTGDYAGQANKIAFYYGSAWHFLPDLDSTGAAIAIGARHAGVRFYVQDDGASPTVGAYYKWDGAAWVAD